MKLTQKEAYNITINSLGKSTINKIELYLVSISSKIESEAKKGKFSLFVNYLQDLNKFFGSDCNIESILCIVTEHLKNCGFKVDIAPHGYRQDYIRISWG